MINHEPQDTSSLDSAKAGSNPTNARNDTPRQTSRRIEIRDCPHNLQIKMKEQTSRREFLGRSLKTGLALAIPTILTGKARGDTIVYNIGKLLLTNTVNDSNFDKISYNTVHIAGAKEEYEGLPDGCYNQEWGPFTKTTKIVSIVQDSELINHELINDVRPLESFTPVNLELSLHEINENSINVINLESWLRCVIDPRNKGYDFSPKPITLWRRFPSQPDYLQFLADIREACAKQGGVGIVPLPDLNGAYGSQVPYDFLQFRFDVYPGDFDLNGKVNIKDLSYIGQDWGKKGQPLEHIGDITGQLGLPDGSVDAMDLELLTRHWLKDIKDIMPAE